MTLLQFHRIARTGRRNEAGKSQRHDQRYANKGIGWEAKHYITGLTEGHSSIILPKLARVKPSFRHHRLVDLTLSWLVDKSPHVLFRVLFQ